MNKLKLAIKKLAQQDVRFERINGEWYEIGYYYQFHTNPRNIITWARDLRSARWGRSISNKTDDGKYLRCDGAPVSVKFKHIESRARRRQDKIEIKTQQDEIHANAELDEQEEIERDQMYLLWIEDCE